MGIYIEEIKTDKSLSKALINMPDIEKECEHMYQILLKLDYKNMFKFLKNLNNYAIESTWDGGYLDNYVYDAECFKLMQAITGSNYINFEDFLDYNSDPLAPEKMFAKFLLRYPQFITTKLIVEIFSYLEKNEGINKIDDLNILYKDVIY